MFVYIAEHKQADFFGSNIITIIIHTGFFLHQPQPQSGWIIFHVPLLPQV